MYRYDRRSCNVFSRALLDSKLARTVLCLVITFLATRAEDINIATVSALAHFSDDETDELTTLHGDITREQGYAYLHAISTAPTTEELPSFLSPKFPPSYVDDHPSYT